MEEKNSPRIDKWLWAVRLYKTRNQAAQACRIGRVKVDGQPVKPSREVTQGMEISLHQGPVKRLVQVKELLHNRVGAKLVEKYMLDLTPEEEWARAKAVKTAAGQRPRGSGRPTKKERREMDGWQDWD